MKKINLAEEMLDRNGERIIGKVKHIKVVTSEEGEPVEDIGFDNNIITVGSMLLTTCIKEDGEQDRDEILRRYNLFKEMDGKDEVSLGEDDIIYLEELICRHWDVYFAGKLIEIINK